MPARTFSLSILAGVALWLPLLTSLPGCAGSIPESTPMSTGAPVAAPGGWIIYCSEQLEDKGCQSN